jgi:putative flippase GtrA
VADLEMSLVRKRTFRLLFVVGVLNTAISLAVFPLPYLGVNGIANIAIILMLSHAICTPVPFFSHRIITFESKGAYL